MGLFFAASQEPKWSTTKYNDIDRLKNSNSNP